MCSKQFGKRLYDIESDLRVILTHLSTRRKSPLKFERAILKLDPATTYFPTPERCSVISSNRLNFRVRDGNQIGNAIICPALRRTRGHRSTPED